MQRFLILFAVLLMTVSPALGNEYFAKAKQSFADEKYNKAQKYLKKILKNEPENISALCLLADIYAAQQKFKTAITILKDLNKKWPDDVSILAGLGQVYFRGEYYRDSAAIYESVLEKESGNVKALYMVGMNKALCMDLDEAYSVYRRLKKTDEKLAANLLHQIQGY